MKPILVIETPDLSEQELVEMREEVKAELGDDYYVMIVYNRKTDKVSVKLLTPSFWDMLWRFFTTFKINKIVKDGGYAPKDAIDTSNPPPGECKHDRVLAEAGIERCTICNAVQI